MIHRYTRSQNYLYESHDVYFDATGTIIGEGQGRLVVNWRPLTLEEAKSRPQTEELSAIIAAIEWDEGYPERFAELIEDIKKREEQPSNICSTCGK